MTEASPEIQYQCTKKSPRFQRYEVSKKSRWIVAGESALLQTRPREQGSVAGERAIASVPAVVIELPSAHVPLPAAPVPVHVHDATRGIEEIPVAVNEEVALLAVRLLANLLRDACADCRRTRELVTVAELRRDLAIVGVPNEVVRLANGGRHVVDWLCLRQHAIAKPSGDPEALASLLIELLRVVFDDGIELHIVAVQTQDG